MSTVGSERAVLWHPRLASLATAEWPAWVWSADGARILWANAVGAAIFGAANSVACAGRRFAMTELPPAQVLRLAATLPSGGQERLERLRGFGGRLGGALTCTCSRIVAGDGRGAVLIVAAEPAGPALPLAERVRRLLDDDTDAGAVFMPDGRLLYANTKAQHWLEGAGSLAALGLEALAGPTLQDGATKAATTSNGAACEVLIARLGEGPGRVLLVMPQQAGQIRQSPDTELESDSGPAVPTAAATSAAVKGAKDAADRAPAVERRHPLRFVWDMDADGRFSVASDEFIQLIGWQAASLGRPWPDIAAELNLDPTDQVANAVASRETWSGIAISWPIVPAPSDSGSELRLPIELSGLPVFDRDRNFRGYRGFGVCRDLTQINGLARPPRTEPATRATPQPDLSPAETGNRAAAAASAPIATPPGGDATAANVVPFRPTPAAEPKAAPSLTPIERRAFRELAQELTSRLRSTQVAATAEALSQGLVAASQDHALSQDELRRVLSQALTRENGEEFSAEENRQAAQEMPDERAAAAPDGVVDEETQQLGPSEAASERLDEDTTKQAAALPASSQHLIGPALLDRIPLGILIFRHDGLLHANQQFLDLSGYDDVAAIEAAGGLNRLFADPAGVEPVTGDRPSVAQADAEPVRTALPDAAIAQALAIVTRSGERVPVEGRMVTVPWDATPAMAIFIDKQQLRGPASIPTAPTNDPDAGAAAREREAQAIAAIKAEFAARVSHDIRNPLNAITGFAEAIMSERFGPIGNERYREYIRDLHGAAAHLSSMVDDLFDLSKPESGRIALTFASINLNELIQQCVGIMQPHANRARIIIRSALTSGLPLVKANERALRQIVLNLLSNSIKFTGPGGQIIVSTVFSDTREAILRVRDTGVGMNDKQIVAALQPSGDIDAWANSGPGGTEHGLPLTKALAEANHAQFRIKSAPSAGTLIEIAFAPHRTLAA